MCMCKYWKIYIWIMHLRSIVHKLFMVIHLKIVFTSTVQQAAKINQVDVLFKSVHWCGQSHLKPTNHRRIETDLWLITNFTRVFQPITSLLNWPISFSFTNNSSFKMSTLIRTITLYELSKAVFATRNSPKSGYGEIRISKIIHVMRIGNNKCVCDVRRCQTI